MNTRVKKRLEATLKRVAEQEKTYYANKNLQENGLDHSKVIYQFNQIGKLVNFLLSTNHYCDVDFTKEGRAKVFIRSYTEDNVNTLCFENQDNTKVLFGEFDTEQEGLETLALRIIKGDSMCFVSEDRAEVEEFMKSRGKK